ncbi:hypothetical protein F5B22DRAFT_576885 [Xylaria bambusicola]|uniref:uncharacterized protein n=1 Tax=Xylaria bambusicola TaxID=326684 RepID=UPI00200732F4|nr:uncharacterized protein F5B22DRAFT_576885 [Xylaria bambusicola]KAI0503030.1 hypothetical protein F5B22DRAFT_576885 [Xylaria bambusicola]
MVEDESYLDFFPSTPSSTTPSQLAHNSLFGVSIARAYLPSRTLPHVRRHTFHYFPLRIVHSSSRQNDVSLPRPAFHDSLGSCCPSVSMPTSLATIRTATSSGVDSKILTKIKSSRDVIVQMKQIKGADYMPGFALDAENLVSEQVKYIPFETMKLRCFKAPISRKALMRGFLGLEGLPDTVMCSNKPHGCGRISCSWYTGIFWCNNADTDSGPHPCNIFGQYARYIYHHCHTPGGNGLIWGALIDDRNRLEVTVNAQEC